MLGILRKLRNVRNLLNRRKPDPDEITEEKWIADFGREKQVRFNIKSESSHDANLRKNLFNSGHSLVLSLKKSGCIAWVEAREHRYRDMVISGSVRIDAKGGYGAGGLMFRMVDEGTYYSFLISSKGYFRLDVARNGMPQPLVGWTELPLSPGEALNPDTSVDFSIIVYGSHIVILVQGRWAAEINDSSVLEGVIAFTAASYDQGAGKTTAPYFTEVFLESFTVDSHIDEAFSLYEKWRNSPDIDPKARLHLAETFTALGQFNAAFVQLLKSWEINGYKKTQAELLLAGRLAQALGIMSDAENYISQCFEAGVETPEGMEALLEMAKILYSGERYKELNDFCTEALKIKRGDARLFAFQGHAFWNLKEYKKAAASYDKAFDLDRENGIFAKNAANVYDVMDQKKEALDRYIKAGKVFLKAGNFNDLGLLVPKLVFLGKDDWEARSLAGKWAFAVEDWETARTEFKTAEELRKVKKPAPHKDGAQIFLEALLLIRLGKRREALPLLENAAALEKNYALFRFRLAENLFLLNNDPADTRMLKELNAALSLSEKSPDAGLKISAEKEDDGLCGWINNFAAQVALQKGDLEEASKYLEKAFSLLGGLPAVRVNRAVLFYLNGDLDKALEFLEADKQSDPEGIMANCAGNLLVRSGRFEDADGRYRAALMAKPDNAEYLCNRASCLIELRLFGEADELLARAHTIAPGPAVLEMISFVAAKKGEYARAEQACRSALEMDPEHAQSLLSLSWILITVGRHAEVPEFSGRLDKLRLSEDLAKGRKELNERLDALFFQTVKCASCSRSWKMPKNPPPVSAIRLLAMPPDDLPAGSCLGCGKTFCIGCARKNLDASGRFICPDCNRPLKLVNEGLKKLIHDWAVKTGIMEAEKSAAEDTPPAAKRGKGKSGKTREVPAQPPFKKSRGRPPKAPETDPPAQEKRPRGRPPKTTKAAVPVPVKRPRGRPRKTGI